MAIRDTKEYKEIHIRVLRVKFEKLAERWKNLEVFDDRAVFCNLYHKLIEVFRTLPAELDNYVLVALNAKFREDEAMLDSIAKVFEGR